MLRTQYGGDLVQERNEVCIEMKSLGLWAGLANYTLPVLPVSQLAYCHHYYFSSLNSGKQNCTGGRCR